MILLRTAYLALRKNPTLTHLAILFPSLIGWMLTWLTLLFSSTLNKWSPGFYPHVEFLYFPDKPGRIYSYIAACFVIFFVAGVTAIVHHRATINNGSFKRLVLPRCHRIGLATVSLYSFLSLISTYCALASLRNSIPAWMSLAGSVSLVFLLVWIFKDSIGLLAEKPLQALQKRTFPLAIIGFSVASLALVFGPLVCNKPQIINEYLDLPSQIKDNGNGAPGNVLNELTRRKIIGPHPFTNQISVGEPAPIVPAYLRIKAAPTPALTEIENIYKPKYLFPLSTKSITSSPGVPERALMAQGNLVPAPYYYDQENSEIVICNVLTDNDVSHLLSTVTDNEKPRITQDIAACMVNTKPWERQVADLKLIEDLSFELRWQVMSRYMIHHHNFMIGPMDQYLKNRPVDEINFQYGKFATISLAKFMDHTGGLSLQHYLSTLHAIHFIYLISSIALSYLILRNVLQVAIFSLVSTIVIFAISHEFLILAPGLNPFRHLFDITIIALSCLAFRSKGSRFIVLTFTAFALSLVGIASNATTGAPLAAALVFCVGLRLILDKHHYVVVATVTTLALVLIATVAIYTKGTDSLTPYYLKGLIGMQEASSLVIAFLVLVSASYLYLIIKWNGIDKPQALSFLLCLLYSQGLFLYYVWGGSRYHLYNFSSIYALTALMGTSALYTAKTAPKIVRIHTLGAWSALITSASLIIISLITCCSWLFSVKNYKNTFDTHMTHEWISPRISISTTMPEQPFIDASTLIKKYNQATSIYIISQFDNILPFYADKYSALPYSDLQWFLNTPYESQNVTRILQDKKPEFIFVDSNIESNRSFEQFNSNFSGLEAESLVRIRRLEALAKIFKSIKDNYLLQEHGAIVSVYRRK